MPLSFARDERSCVMAVSFTDGTSGRMCVFLSFFLKCKKKGRLKTALSLSGNPACSSERHARHGGGLDGEGTQILRLEVVHVVVAAGAGDGLHFQRHHLQV